jgi:hypothetical protein
MFDQQSADMLASLIKGFQEQEQQEQQSKM